MNCFITYMHASMYIYTYIYNTPTLHIHKQYAHKQTQVCSHIEPNTNIDIILPQLDKSAQNVKL